MLVKNGRRVPGKLARPFRELNERGITRDNYHLHLNEMEDSEITAMLDLTQGKEEMDRIRKAYPKQSDRTYAEFLRDN
jgi:hypothetical protein